MRRDLDRLAATAFDLLVIGGGIHGLAAAYDAAQRGLAVALVERDDFGGGASFNHLRTVHGGLRSLQTGDLRKFRLSIRERRTFARIAPHLVEPLAFLLPTSGALTRSRPALAMAFLIDAILGADRNRDLPARLHLPRGRTLSRAECLAIDPTLADRSSTASPAGATAGAIGGGPAHAISPVTGGALWYDYQMPRAERLTLAFALAASDAGAALANYVGAEEVRLDAGRVAGVRLRDSVSGATFEVRARVVLNAAGAGVPALLASSHVDRALPLLLQKAINLVTTRPMGPSALGAGMLQATAICRSHAGGTLIRVPWRGRTIIGTWHSSAAGAAASGEVTAEELDHVIADINATFPGFNLDREEVTLVHRGLVPAQADGHGGVRMQNESTLLDHAGDGAAGLISIRGAKYTTARAVAEAAVDLVERQLGRTPTRSRTADTPLPGAPTTRSLGAGAAASPSATSPPRGSAAHRVAADADARASAPDRLADELCRAHPHVSMACAQHLALAYGTRGGDVLALARDMPALAEPIDPAHPAIGAEILYAVREEMALTLTDVVARRIQLGVAGHPGDHAARACAAIMRDECGWSESRTDAELRALRELYRPV
jgi:glycerol-3-phosphate dehydrogenase